ncbi:MAG: hypothetical protein JHC79_01235 [Williamsia sp.]|nr:hypothetical protein [Williamsia sp.]
MLNAVEDLARQQVSDIDKSLLLAMAHDDGPSKMADIQRRLDVGVDFALPYLREYLRDNTKDNL